MIVCETVENTEKNFDETIGRMRSRRNKEWSNFSTAR
jgi:hypothetical protein